MKLFYNRAPDFLEEIITSYEKKLHKPFIFSKSNNCNICAGSHPMMFEIDHVVNVLKNGKWHNLDDIVRISEMPEIKVEIVLKFLAEFHFVEIDDDNRKVKIAPRLQKFLRESQ